jgi:hypothetical protein
MTIGHDLEQRLESWMQEDATLPDDLREVLAKLPETPQRHHRWSFTLAELSWRTRTMFSATRVAATIAIFALGASIALIAGPLGPASEVVPGQLAVESPAPPAIVSGVSSSINVEDPGVEVPGSAIPIVHGHVSVVEAEMDDPRVSGTYTLTQSAQDHGGMGPMLGTMRVENEEGAWEGPVEGYWTNNDTHFSGCLTGEAAYEGLTYCMRTSADAVRFDVALDGLIYQGDLQPAE